MRNKTIRVAVVGAMLVSFALTVSPAQARDRWSARGGSRGALALLSPLGAFLLQWAEALTGSAPADLHASSKSVPAPAGGNPVHNSDSTTVDSDRSGAIDPWGVR